MLLAEKAALFVASLLMESHFWLALRGFFFSVFLTCEICGVA